MLGEELAFSKHSAVIAAFGKRFVKTGHVPSEFHSYLIEGQASRNIGDYDIKQGLTENDAKEQIGRAEKFLGMAQRLLDPDQEHDRE